MTPGSRLVVALLALAGSTSGFSKDLPTAPTREAYKMMYELCDISGYGVNSGIHPGPKADKVAKYIFDGLKKAGLKNVELELVKVNDPFPDKYEMTAKVDGEAKPKNIEGFPLPWTVGTTPKGITGELAYVKYGTISDFELVDVKGKIALIDHRHYRHLSTVSDGAVARAKAKGAIGVILAETQVDGPKMKFRPGTPASLFPIPGYSVGKSVGAYLRILATSGKQYTINYALSVPHKVVDSYNVVAKLPGNGSMKEAILVGSHYDTVFTGAIDNLSTVALILKWAEYFASKPTESRNRDMIFAFCVGHDSFDANSGHQQFAKRHADELNNVIVWDTDHSAGGTRYVEVDGEFKPTDSTSVIYTTANNYSLARLASFYLDRHGFVNTVDEFSEFKHGSGPGWGIAPPKNPWSVSASVTTFYHSTLDTPEKITLDQMTRAYATHIDILEAVDRSPEGFFRYDTLDKTRPNTAPTAKLTVLTETARVGDTVWASNDDTLYRDDKTSFLYPGVPEWASLKFDWGDGITTFSYAEIPVTHIYKEPGTYTITMTMTDTEGATTKDTQQISVLDKLHK